MKWGKRQKTQEKKQRREPSFRMEERAIGVICTEQTNMEEVEIQYVEIELYIIYIIYYIKQLKSLRHSVKAFPFSSWFLICDSVFNV